MSAAAPMGEFDLIRQYFAPMAGEGAFELKDDAACLRPRAGHDLVITTDALVGNVHFFTDDPAGSIARKALGVNLSDLAAKGAEPRGFLLSLCLPDGWTTDWLHAFSDGLAEAAREARSPLLGGDTTRTSGSLTLSITALGDVPEGAMVMRSGARPGDIIGVTGTIGDAALGLALRLTQDVLPLSSTSADFLSDRYLHPQPRLAMAPILRARASAAMDVSDGLAGDLAKLVAASGCGAEWRVESVPLSPAARAAIALIPGLLETALTGGDDYEILFTVPESAWRALADEAKNAGVPVTAIGKITDGSKADAMLEGMAWQPERASFTHF